MGAARDRWRRELERVGWEGEALRSFLERHSGLPGPRANLELAAALAARCTESPPAAAVELLFGWAELPCASAPTGSRAEFIPFAATRALGVLVRAPGLRRRGLAGVRRSALDPRWRLREAAAMALQALGEHDAASLRAELGLYLEEGTPLLLRAALAALAHPPLLASAELRALAWTAAERALAALQSTGTDVEGARVLGLALAYAPSVLTAAEPEEGFRHLRRWAWSSAAEVKRLVVANLRKARLARRFPEDCERVAGELEDGG